jgi:hypothetical protein
MAVGDLVELVYGVDAEQRCLEDVATPISADSSGPKEDWGAEGDRAAFAWGAPRVTGPPLRGAPPEVTEPPLRGAARG